MTIAEAEIQQLAGAVRQRVLDGVYPLPAESLNEREWARFIHDDLPSMSLAELNNEIAQLRLRFRLDPRSKRFLWLGARAAELARAIEDRRQHGLG